MQSRGVTFPNRASVGFQDTKPLVKDSWITARQWDFCQNLNFWLNMIPLKASWYDNQVYPDDDALRPGVLAGTAMKALPHYTKYSEEMTLLDRDTNSLKEA